MCVMNKMKIEREREKVDTRGMNHVTLALERERERERINGMF